MASPGIVRLMADLWKDEVDGIHPIVDIDTGEVTYPEANARLDERDDSAFEVLETLAEQNRLHREFQEKQYICPQCTAKGMQYTSACPSCGSPETTRTERYRHTACGHEGLHDQFVDDEEVVCQECEISLNSLEQLESDTAHVCNNCDVIFQTPDHRLRCRDCHLVTHPMQSTERILYQYYLTPQGEEWIEEQLTARQAVAETLQNRTLQTDIDTTVTNGSDNDIPVHISAYDELLNDHIIAAVHEQPDESAITNLLRTAADVDAQAILATTSGTVVGEDVDQLVTNDRLTILQVTAGGTLNHDYEVVADPTTHNSFVGRIASIFEPQNG
ncbi:hypothetical protein [Halomicrococcus sp. NG-SE-24]|uniref:TackOD1 domain-containing metal-binding protein n=1 Tax=Halomicrococcus sp. NG-SE-24 TaxID=3436928 RepID=UPI003D957686